MERMTNLFSWAHPKKTQIFVLFVLFMFIITMIFPSRLLILFFGWYQFLDYFIVTQVVMKTAYHFFYSVPNDGQLAHVFKRIAFRNKHVREGFAAGALGIALDDEDDNYDGLEERCVVAGFGEIKCLYSHSIPFLTFRELIASLRNRGGIIWSGYMRKRGKLFHSWNRRFFVLLEDGSLQYWLNEEKFLEGATPRGQVIVEREQGKGASIKSDGGVGVSGEMSELDTILGSARGADAYFFAIHCKLSGRTLLMAADSEEDREEALHYIKTTCHTVGDAPHPKVEAYVEDLLTPFE